MEYKINFHLCLIKKDGSPLKGLSTHVKLFDSDLVKDDYLGSIILDEAGKGKITVTSDDFKSFDSPFEELPDVYFEVYKGDELIFKSKIFKDIRVEENELQEDGIKIELGTFVIE